MLKNYRRLLMVIAVLAAAVLVYKIWPRPPKYVRPRSPSKEIVKSLMGSPVDLGIAPKTPKVKEATANADESKCVSEAMEIARMSLIRVADLIMDDRQELKLCGPSYNHLKGLVEKIKANCVRKPNPPEAQKQECMANIALYRASLIDELTNGSDLSQLPEPSLLNKAFALFNEANWKDKEHSPALVAKMDKIADELLRRRPDWDFAEKLKLAARMMSEDLKGMAAIAEKASQTHPEDADFLEAYFYSLTQGPPEKLMATVDNHLRQFPNDPIGHYWKAAGYHIQHDEQNAKIQVEQAKWLDPDNSRYSDTLNRLASGSSESAFSMQIKLPFDDMD